MTGETFTRQGVGRPVRASAINGPQPAVEGLSRLRVGGGLAQQRIAGVPLIRATPPAETGLWAQLTTTAAAATANGGKYSWYPVHWDDDGTITTDGQPEGGDSGGDDGYAREVYGLTVAQAGNVVWLSPAPMADAAGHSYYLFRSRQSFAARTKVLASYPNVAAAFYGVETQTIGGAQVEGGAATIATDGNTYFALNLGSAIPPQGTPVIVSEVSPPDGGAPYFAFRYDG